MHWSSKIPQRYKRNAILSDTNTAAAIASVLTNNITKIREKVLNTDNPQRFIYSIINQFIGEKNDEDH